MNQTLENEIQNSNYTKTLLFIDKVRYMNETNQYMRCGDEASYINKTNQSIRWGDGSSGI